MTNPLVSVVLPTHNRSELVGKAIRSVLNQTERSIELIVVDDGSIDNTQVVLNQYAKSDPRVRILRNLKSLGGGAARNVGITGSSGEWVAFLDDDDTWIANKLRMQLEKLTSNSEAVACSCSYEQYSSLGQKQVIRLPENITLEQLYKSNYLGGASMCIAARSVLLSIGGFDAKFKSGQDWDLWVRLRSKGKIVVCSEPLIKYQNNNSFRISNNMDAQYFGARRFYFKHRQAMSTSLRLHRVSYSCFIMSRQIKRRLSARLRYLILSLRHSGFDSGYSYVRSSLPRLAKDWIRTIYQKNRY